MTTRSLALTGHRPHKLDGYDLTRPFYENLRNYLLRGLIGELARLDPDDVLECHSGLALGADTVWSQAILTAKARDARMRFVAHIPTPTQASKWHEVDQAAWQYQRVMADEEIIYAASYTRSCMQERNIGMIARCDSLIAIWDGNQTGGTWNAVNHARRIGKPLIAAHPDTFRA